MNRKNHLFTLTITPVQTFISQARKTKDLFAGSKILSNLMKEAVNEFKKEGTVIFPQNDSYVSNKFVGKLENKTEDDVRNLGKRLEKHINKEFIKKIFENTCKYESALENFFKVFWVAVELEDDYAKSYKKLEQNLGAIKNLRAFEQIKQPKGLPKCSLCGERNIEEEKLCLVCLAKRECKLENENEDYPSTAKIALLDWLKKTNRDKIQKYKKIFTKNEFDEELLFKDNLTESYFKKNNIKINKLQEAKSFLDTLDTSTQKKYYALIQFDIDNMGKKLSSLDEEEQKELSKALAEFGKKAKNILNSQYNDTKCTIYAGGDDFLGFVNLEYLFSTIRDIKESFKDEVQNKFSDLTYSTSIIIAHYKAPLHKVLDFSRELLQESKNHFKDKNGMGIIVMSSNSINAKTICKYEYFNLLKELKEKEVGFNLHYKLKTVFNYLDKMDFDEYLQQKEIIKVEIKRLLKRESGEFDEDLYNQVIDFLNMQTIELSTNNYKIDFENFIGYLKTLEQLKKVM